MSTIRFSRSATCFFSPRGCCTIVTNSPMIALPSRLDQAVEAERRPARRAWRATATSAKSRSSSARKKRSGSSGEELRRQRPAVDAVLVVELDRAVARRLGVREHVVVGEQQRAARPASRCRSPASAAGGVADVHAADRPRGGDARVEVADADEVVGVDDLLEQRGALGRRARRRRSSGSGDPAAWRSAPACPPPRYRPGRRAPPRARRAASCAPRSARRPPRAAARAPARRTPSCWFRRARRS